MVKAIFCINPGRSGSHYLSGLLSESKNCESYHEAAPSGFGKPLQQFNRGDATAMSDVARQLAELVKSANARNMIFSDTTHCFIKGFGWQILDHLDEADIGIVVLKRDKQAVVDSTVRALSVPLRNLGRRFVLSPDRKSPLVTPPSFLGLAGPNGFAVARLLHYLITFSRRVRRKIGLSVEDTVIFPEYQKAAVAWYWEETYALGEKFRKDHPNCKYFDATTDDLNNPDVVRELFSFFGVTPDKELSEKIGVPTNLKLG